ncbi:pilus assembly protein, partial [Escherichia coli]
CEATFLSQLASVEYGNKLESKLRQDNQTMKDLIEQVKNAKDTKATQDATNAVALEQLKFEKLKFQYQMYIDKQKQLSEYKKEMAKASFRHEQINAKPIDYREAFSTQDFDLIK